MLGTTDGQLVVISSTGILLSQSTLQQGVEITCMSWPGEKFKFTDDITPQSQGNGTGQQGLARGLDSVDSGVRVESMSSLNSSCSIGE